MSLRQAPAAPTLAVALAVALGATLDAVIKHLGGSIHPVMIAFGRFAFGTLVAIGFYLATSARRIHWDQARFHAGRGLVIVVSATTFFYALSVMPLVEAITIGFLAPLIVPGMAWILLRERPPATSLPAALLGFVGVIIAIAGAPVDDAAYPDRLWGALAAFVAVIAYALQLTLLRMRAGIDGPAITTLFANLFPALYLAIPALLVAPIPPLETAPLFLVLGFLGAGLWTLMAWAYARAPAAALAPLEYSALIWSAALGFAFFDEVPRLQTIIGGIVIAGACLWLAWDEQRRARLAAAAAS